MEAATKGGGEPNSTVFAVQNLPQMLPKWLVPVAAVVLASFSVIYLFFWRIPHVTKPLLVIAMSACPAVTSGMHRITSDFGIGFDASQKMVHSPPDFAGLTTWKLVRDQIKRCRRKYGSLA
jgi:hypothetical protein